MAHFSPQAKPLSHRYKAESMDNCRLLSDTPSSEAEHLVGMGDGTAVSSLSDLPLDVRNRYLTCQSPGKGSGVPSILSSTVPTQSFRAESKDWGRKGSPHCSVTLGQKKVAGGWVKNAAALLLPVGQTSDYELGREREPSLSSGLQ